MITLTTTAEKYIKEQIQAHANSAGIRFAVKGAGCGGYSYVVEFVYEAKSNDNIFKQNDVRMYIDPKSLFLLDGLQVDYVTNGFNSGLEFSNPNATHCGCGESFNIK